MNVIIKPKSRKVSITFEEYESILYAIEDMESNIGGAEIEYVEPTEKAIKQLKKLINKILKI